MDQREALYTIRTDSFMKGYVQQFAPDGYFDTLGLLSQEQAVERLRAKGYEVVRYLPDKEAKKLARSLREQNRKPEPEKPVTAFDIFCMIAEIMELRERRRLKQKIEEAMEG